MPQPVKDYAPIAAVNAATPSTFPLSSRAANIRYIYPEAEVAAVVSEEVSAAAVPGAEVRPSEEEPEAGGKHIANC